MYAIITMTLVLWLVTPAESSNIPGVANRADHAALCKFIAMASREVEVPEIPALPTDEYDYIHMVNFSTAPESWQNIFFEDKATKKAHADPKAAGAANRGFETNWGQWQTTALSHSDATTAEAKKKAGVVQLSDTEAALVKPQLAHLAALADELITELSGLQPGPGSTTASSAKQLLTTAAYGEETVPKPNPNPEKVFGAALNGNRDAICEAKAACNSNADGTGTWQDSDSASTTLNSAYLAKLAKTCSSATTDKVTRMELRTTINDLGALIHKGESDAYLGAFVSSKCNGSSGNGVCVKFATYSTKKKPIVSELTWIPPLTELLTKLDSLESKKQRAQQLVDQTKSLKKETTVVIEVAKATASTMEKFETKTNNQKPTSEATSRCSTHNTNKTCTEKVCKWNSTAPTTGKNCKPKNGEGQRNTRNRFKLWPV
uniref:Variant surface glycoprotein 1125.4890 n=1 Tax=Trypanosoma brucei TaxID=5691 RepID=A0A1J0RB17_9TRYP|nr:variant surface glycoprotein 1125.4890 [Trypanosoma brucei]